MRILVVGGTLFVGRAVVDRALEQGHEVILFNRGKTNPWLFPDVEHIVGDRDGDLMALGDLRFDVVVDTSAYFPRQIRAMTTALADRFDTYVLVSSASVYADQSLPGADEGGAVDVIDDPDTEELGANYGPLKALCEEALTAAVGSKAFIVRAGLIVGEYDDTGRFSYWVRRMAEGGEVLAPRPKNQPVQFIDVRDLASWIIDASVRGVSGTFNAAGPHGALNMEGLLKGIEDTVGGDVDLTWVDERFLVERDVEVWSGLPLWLSPDALPSHAGFMSRDTSRAAAAGLTVRPLEDTVRATLAWEVGSESTSGAKDFGNPSGSAGISRERERALLDEWHATR
jgi:2'-hydroxyisoflavone reductase